jgi:hypothetical protein
MKSYIDQEDKIMGQLFGSIIGIGYFVLGIVQWFAIIDGLEIWFGISGFFAFILSGIISYIPLVGTIAGFKGAIDVWGWSFLEAGALFFGPLLIFALFAFISSMGNRN